MKYKICMLVFYLQGVVFTCDVPVFRYALERWERDLYRVLIVHRGDLNEEESVLVEQLNEGSLTEGGYANIVVYDIDLDDEKNRQVFHNSFQSQKGLDPKKAQILLVFPAKIKFYKDVVWQGELNQKNIDELLNSKVTTELMNGVLQGNSTTLLLMESGDVAKDEKAFIQINKTITKIKDELFLPKGIVKTDGKVTGGELTPGQAARRDPSNVLKSGIPLKIDFNLVRMSKDQSNSIFRAILSRTHDSTGTQNNPKLYAFFGRGRLLGPIVGEEINPENIEELVSYLCSACSCQVKRQNPGIDFLTNMDWMGYLEGSEVVIDKKLPPLIGMLDLEQSLETQDSMSEVETAAVIELAPEESVLMGNILITLGSVLIVLIGGTFFIRKK